jgi:hypothetical protein
VVVEDALESAGRHLAAAIEHAFADDLEAARSFWTWKAKAGAGDKDGDDEDARTFNSVRDIRSVPPWTGVTV